MIRFISILIMFLRELIFDSKEEYNIKSSSFNARKFIIFILLIVSVFGTFYITVKGYGLAKEVTKLNDEIIELNKKLLKCNSK